MLNYCLKDSHIKYMHHYTSLFPSTPQAFTLNSFGEFHCDSSYYTERNNFNFCLLIYTLDGKGYFEYKSKQYTLKPYTCIVTNCNYYHFYKPLSDRWNFVWFHFTGSSAFELVDELNENTLYICHFGKENLFSHFKTLLYAQNNPSKTASFDVSLTIHKLLCQMFHEKYSITSLSNTSLLANTLEYVHIHYAEKISMDELATQAHLSKYYYIKLFKKSFGVTPYQYILNIRHLCTHACYPKQFHRSALHYRLHHNQNSNLISYNTIPPS